MKNVIIRKIEEKDIPSVVEIQVNGWKTAYKGIIDDEFLNSMDIEERIEKRKKDYNQNGFIVAEFNDEVVGFCRYIDNNSNTKSIPYIDCELLSLYVKSSLKNKGIGKALFQYVVDEFKKKKKTKMIIWCLKDNEPSKTFYTKMGGEIIKEREIEIGDKRYVEVGFKYHI